nr:hypothetical protein [Actinoplanes sp. DH11]
MPDAWRAYLDLALGLTEAPRKKAQQVAGEVLSKGGATATQLQGMVEDLLSAGMANREALTNIVRFEVDRALARVGLATADEVSDLTSRVHDLERQLRDATVSPGAASGPGAGAKSGVAAGSGAAAGSGLAAGSGTDAGPGTGAGSAAAAGSDEAGSGAAVPRPAKKAVAKKAVAKKALKAKPNAMPSAGTGPATSPANVAGSAASGATSAASGPTSAAPTTAPAEKAPAKGATAPAKKAPAKGATGPAKPAAKRAPAKKTAAKRVPAQPQPVFDAPVPAGTVAAPVSSVVEAAAATELPPVAADRVPGPTGGPATTGVDESTVTATDQPAAAGGVGESTASTGSAPETAAKSAAPRKRAPRKRAVPRQSTPADGGGRAESAEA